MIFNQKNEGFLSSCFTTDEEIFGVLNPSEKDREKQCFVIFSLLSHNLTGKLLFSQKRVNKASNLTACCFRCFQIFILMLSNYTFDALLQGKRFKVLKLKNIPWFSVLSSFTSSSATYTVHIFSTVEISTLMVTLSSSIISAILSRIRSI